MKNKITDAMIIGYLTVISYMAARMYKIGYYIYFNLPTNFIEVETNFVFSFALGIAVFYIIFFLIIGGIIDLLLPLNMLFSPRKLAEYGVAFLPMCYIYYTSDFKVIYLYLILTFIALIFLVDFIIPVIKYRKVKGIKEKLKTAENESIKKSNFENENISLIGKISSKYPEYSTVLFLTIVLLITAYAKGSNIALKQTEFITFCENNTTYIIFDTLEDKLVTKEINLSTMTLSSSFKLSSWKENTNYSSMELKGVVVGK